MQRQVEQIYRSKLQNIEQKFKIISQAYQKLTVQIQQKNEVIQDLNRVIQILEINLQQSNSKLQQANANIQKLQARLEKQTMIKKVFIATQNKSNPFIPQSAKVSISNMPLLSETSIIPKISIQKEHSQLQESNQIKLKYVNLLRSAQPDSKATMIDEKLSQFQKTIEKYQFQPKNLSKKVDYSFNNQKLSDLTNIRVSKSSLQTKEKEFLGIQTQPITHQKEGTSKLNQTVNKEASMKTLTKIWQERDREIQKMDELFQSINSKLKQFEQ